MMKALLIFTLALLAGTCVGARKLMIVEQDYEEALCVAEKAEEE